MQQNLLSRTVLWQCCGGIGWAVFFVLSPFDLLLLSALAWIPFLIWRERVRAARYGMHPGFAVRLGTIGVIVAIAAALPLKSEDQRVGPLAQSELTLGELAANGITYPLFDATHASIRVRLPSSNPTRREVMRAISDQTGFRTSIFHCGTGATVLFGGGVGRITISDVD